MTKNKKEQMVEYCSRWKTKKDLRAECNMQTLAGSKKYNHIYIWGEREREKGGEKENASMSLK